MECLANFDYSCLVHIDLHVKLDFLGNGCGIDIDP